MQRHFYAFAEDCALLLSEFETRQMVRYHRAGNFTSRPGKPFQTWSDLPDIGVAHGDSSNACPNYLISPVGSEPVVRTMGGFLKKRRFLVDQLVNPETVTLNLGGVWRDEALLSGRVACAHSNPVSTQLIRSFDAGFRKHFVKVKAYWVGPQALAYLNQGGRLTAAIQCPADYDLQP